MGNTLYLECSSGISGDMAVAALLDLGADQEVLKKAVASLPVEGCSIEISRVKKSGLDACDFLVHLDEAHENHDHDMEYLHGTEEQCRSHVHSHDQGEGHHTHTHFHGEYMHTHEGNSHGHSHEAGAHHTHRGLQEVLAIISQAELSGRAKETAVRIFTILAEAEAKAHGVPLEQVHFHEVGAVDSIVDIVGAAICYHSVAPDAVYASSVNVGSGFVKCAHGLLPVPAPATAEILAGTKIPVYAKAAEGECATPTGAAILAELASHRDRLPAMNIETVGYGFGEKEFEVLNALRMFVGEC